MRYTLSQQTVNRVREVLNRRQDGGGLTDSQGSHVANDVDTIHITADNGDGTYDGTIRRYNSGSWVSYNAVTVIEANGIGLDLDTYYAGIRYGPDIYIVWAGTAGSYDSLKCVEGCLENCCAFVPKEWTVSIGILDDECEECNEAGGDYTLQRIDNMTWQHVDPNIKITLTLYGKQFHPQAKMDVTIKACDVTYTYQLNGAEGFSWCLTSSAEGFEIPAPEEPADTIDYATWQDNPPFTIGDWLVAIWEADDLPGGFKAAWTWQYGINDPTYANTIDTDTISISGGFTSDMNAANWLWLDAGLDGIYWYPPDTVITPCSFVPNWDELDTTVGVPKAYGFGHWEYRDGGWVDGPFGQKPDDYYSASSGDYIIVSCCKVRDTGAVITDDAETIYWFKLTGHWLLDVENYLMSVNLEHFYVVGPFVNYLDWIWGEEFEAVFGVPGDESSCQGGGYICPCPPWNSCPHIPLQCCSENTLALTTLFTECEMPPEVTIVPSDEACINPCNNIDVTNTEQLSSNLSVGELTFTTNNNQLVVGTLNGNQIVSSPMPSIIDGGTF